jgi:hypothetical protein
VQSRGARVAIFCVWLAQSTACVSEAEQRARADAERMSRSVTALRDAPNAAKRPLLDALSRVPCSAPDVCRLQQVCVAAYRTHIQAFEQSQSLRNTLDADAASAQQVAPLGPLLRTLELQLGQARKAAERCAELEGEVARAHRR